MKRFLSGYLPRISKAFLGRVHALPPWQAALLVAVTYLAGAGGILAAQQVGLQVAAEWLTGICLVGGLVLASVCLSDTPRRLPAWRGVLLVAAITGAFLLLRWYAMGGSIRDKLGDDDELYIFLGQQIAGMIPGTPLFSFRPPGLPALIGSVLVLTDGTIWPLSLVFSALLVITGGCIYLLTRGWLPDMLAVLAGCSVLFLSLIEYRPFMALSELPYASLSAVALTAVVSGVQNRYRNRWLLFALAGLCFLLRVSVRPAGLAGSLALCLALLIIEGRRTPVRALLAAALIATPSLAFIFGLQNYNFRTTGYAGVSELAGYNAIQRYARWDDRPTPAGPERDYFSALLPEIAPDAVMTHMPSEWFVARLRMLTSPEPNYAAFMEQSERLGTTLLRAYPDVYVLMVWRATYASLMYPRTEFIPLWWYQPQVRPTPPSSAPTHRYSLNCTAQAVVLADALGMVCEAHQEALTSTRFAPDLPVLPSPIRQILHGLTISLQYRLRLMSWVFTWGMAVGPVLFSLIIRPRTRSIGLLLGAMLAAEMLPLIVFGSVESQYQFLFHPMDVVIVWIGISELGRNIAHRMGWVAAPE